MHLRRKPRRPVIKILLIAKLAVLFARVTPFDAAILPLPKDARRRLGIAERDELNAKPAISHIVCILWREGVLRNQHMFAGFDELVEQQPRGFKEEYVRVDVGDALHLWRVAENVARQERSKGPAILGYRPLSLH